MQDDQDELADPTASVTVSLSYKYRGGPPVFCVPCRLGNRDTSPKALKKLRKRLLANEVRLFTGIVQWMGAWGEDKEERFLRFQKFVSAEFGIDLAPGKEPEREMADD